MIETTDSSSLVELEQECMELSEIWFPVTSHSLVHHCLALGGEMGEFFNIVKKVERGSLVLNEEVMTELAMEITDVLIYVLNIGAILNVDLGKSYKLKQEFNGKRFGASSSDNAGGHAGDDSTDELPDDSSAFVPVADVSKPLQGRA
jgi:NTP pyrophosphatase (non-canonical NTP hydrolase)